MLCLILFLTFHSDLFLRFIHIYPVHCFCYTIHNAHPLLPTTPLLSDGHPECLQLSDTTNTAAMNVPTHVPLCTCLKLWWGKKGYVSRNGIAESQDVTWFDQVLSDLFAEWLQEPHSPQHSTMASILLLFLHSWQYSTFSFFQPNRNKVISHYCFNSTLHVFAFSISSSVKFFHHLSFGVLAFFP